MSKAREQMQGIVEDARRGVFRSDSRKNPQDISEADENNPKDAPTRAEHERMKKASMR